MLSVKNAQHRVDHIRPAASLVGSAGLSCRLLRGISQLRSNSPWVRIAYAHVSH